MFSWGWQIMLSTRIFIVPGCREVRDEGYGCSIGTGLLMDEGYNASSDCVRPDELS
jgi:hypothetical protein